MSQLVHDAPHRGAAAPSLAVVEVADLQNSLELDSDGLRALLSRAAALAGYTGSLSVALVGDDAMRELHRRHLDIDEPTDVLSFPLGDGVAEVVISTDTAIRNAAERGAAAAVETLLYAVHGMLHLLGYDDHDPAERRQMQAEERRILAALGFVRPK